MEGEIINTKKSYVIEPIMLIIYLFVFVVAVYTVITLSVRFEEKVYADRQSQSNVRIATSYINVRIKQNDNQNAISVANNSINEKTSILIKKRNSAVDYDLWIFFNDGYLVECYAKPNELPKSNDITKIANIESFEVEKNDNLIEYSLLYIDGNQLKKLENTINTRSK